MRPIFITGGAGYIGSHTTRVLLEAGFKVVVFDDLSGGHREALPNDLSFVQASLMDSAALRAALEEYQPSAIIHFAGAIEAGLSMSDPRRFYDINVVGGLNLLNAVVETKIIPVLFSSTAAVYGEPGHIPIGEDAPKQPTNVYGETKLVFERALQAYANAYGIPSISLRYFNACGAMPDGSNGPDHRIKTHLIPLTLMTALNQRKAVQVFGTDYPTPDGTAIRDYVHVLDLAEAHVLALRAMLTGTSPTYEAYNVGLGTGFAVQQVLDAAERVTGRVIPREYVGRRPGDPPCLVADSTKIQRVLSWRPRFTSLEEMIDSAWQWHLRHPQGFNSATLSGD